MSDDTLLVNEIYGPTWQGEGPSVGKLCYFIRTFGCNQKCIFCDTWYTWATKPSDLENHLYATEPIKLEDECHEMTFARINSELLTLAYPYNHDIDLLVISGGEPMLQAKKLDRFLDGFNYNRVEIETAGTVYHRWLAGRENVFFNVSPKLESSGNPKHIRWKPDVLGDLDKTGKAIFKFVIMDEKDLEEIDEIAEYIGIHPSKVYAMMEGIDRETLEKRTEEFIPQILERGWNITPRLHIDLFGNKRGT